MRRTSRRLRPWLAAVGAALLAGCGGSAGGRAAPPVGTAPASFYRVPAHVAPAAPGTIVRRLALSSPKGARVWAILYHSRSRTGADIVVSGTVAMPATAPPPGGFKLVSVGHGFTGFADATAPSRTGDTGIPWAVRDLVQRFVVRDGYALAMTDYEGLGTPGTLAFGVGLSAGHTVLDAARAAVGFGHMSRDVALVGHSEGGHAVLWAGQLAPTYAPELHVRAIVASAPGADIPAIGRMREVSPGAATTVLTVMASWHAAYGAPLDGLLTQTGFAAVGDILAGRRDVAFPANPFRGNPFGTQPWRDLALENTPGATHIGAPILLLVGGQDQLVPPASNVQFAALLRRAGDEVHLRVDPDADHAYTWLGAMDELQVFVRDRL